MKCFIETQTCLPPYSNNVESSTLNFCLDYFFSTLTSTYEMKKNFNQNINFKSKINVNPIQDRYPLWGQNI